MFRGLFFNFLVNFVIIIVGILFIIVHIILRIFFIIHLFFNYAYILERLISWRKYKRLVLLEVLASVPCVVALSGIGLWSNGVSKYEGNICSILLFANSERFYKLSSASNDRFVEFSLTSNSFF